MQLIKQKKIRSKINFVFKCKMSYKKAITLKYKIIVKIYDYNLS